jgi:hypothetical protein
VSADAVLIEYKLEVVMAEQDRINSILFKLQKQANLTAEEVSALQSHIDQLENLGKTAASEHHSHSSPASHYTDHRTDVVDIVGILERVARQR